MKTKPFSYSRVIKLRDKLYNGALAQYIGQEISSDILYHLHEELLSYLPSSVSATAVFESLRVLAGPPGLRKNDAAVLAWRLAGNIDLLSAGQPVLPWSRQYSDEKVPVRLEKMTAARRRGIGGLIFHCRALAGTPCAMLFPAFVSFRGCSAISRTLGFSAPWGPHAYKTPYHFVNLFFFAHVEAEKSYEYPAFSRVTVSSAMQKANRELIAVRCRVRPCPRMFENPCEHCFVGYDECPFATHDLTYVTRHCSNCNAMGFFNPGSSASNCMQCKRAADVEIVGAEI